MIVILGLLILAIIGALVVVRLAGHPVAGKHARSAPVTKPEPAPLPAAGRMPMLPAPRATFTAAELDDTWTDLPPVTRVGPIVREAAQMIARYTP